MRTPAIVVPIAVRTSTGRAHLQTLANRTRCSSDPDPGHWTVVPLDSVPENQRCPRCFRTAEEKAREKARRQ